MAALELVENGGAELANYARSNCIGRPTGRGGLLIDEAADLVDMTA